MPRKATPAPDSTAPEEVINAVLLRGVQKTVEINRVHPNDYNPQQQSDFIYEKQGISLERFGQVEPITVRTHPTLPAGHYMIINGEHRWRKMKEMGSTHIMVNDLGEVNDVDARQLTIILNELTGEPNAVSLGNLINDIAKMAEGMGISEEDALAVMPFGEIQMSHLRGLGEIPGNLEENEEPIGSRRTREPKKRQQEPSEDLPGLFVEFTDDTRYGQLIARLEDILGELEVRGNPSTMDELSVGESRFGTTTFLGDLLWAVLMSGTPEKFAAAAKKKLSTIYPLP